MRSRRDPLGILDALGRARLPVSPVPEVARRLRLEFPEVWARYERLAAERAVGTRRRPVERSS